MRAPGFWWQPAPSALAHLLSPLGAIYSAITARRMAQAGERASLPVICIGNFVAGGAGKTPSAIAIARALIAMGRKPVFLSRGYGSEITAPHLVDPARDSAKKIGDEPLLLAQIAPTVVASDRVAGAQLCATTGGDIIVMDDGLQNPSLSKDLRLAVVDGAVGVGNGLSLPAGPLRAALSHQWPHVDGVIIIGAGAPGEALAQEAARRGKSVLRGALLPDRNMAAGLKERDVIAFAGIGRPQKFFDTLRALGAEIVEEESFPDHHAYSAREIAGLQSRARRRGAALVTTQKDAVRLGPALAEQMLVLPVDLQLEDETGLAHLLAKLRASH